MMSTFLLAVLAVSAHGIGQKPGPKPVDQQGKDPYVNCPYCNHVGDKVCKKHSKAKMGWVTDSGSIRCSVVAGCKTCRGTLREDCKHCENQTVEGRNKAKGDEIQAWLAERRTTVDGLIGHKVLHAESRWFRLTFDLKPMMVGRVRYSTYRLMHLYLKRFEAHRALFQEVLQVPMRDLPDKCDIYMWRDGRDQVFAATKFTGMGSSGVGIKLMGLHSRYTMQCIRRQIRNDEDLHRHMVHNIAHLLVSQMIPHQWIGKLKAGWIDAGIAHYFEFKLDEKCTTYCWQEVVKETNFKGGKWLVPVRRKVASRQIPSFAAVSTKNTDQIGPEEHALAFSYVHFLLEGDFENDLVKKHGGKGRALCVAIRVLKAKRPTRDALSAGYGWNPLVFEEKWKEWVLRTYPVR